jgi:hypothetical protein
LPPLVVVFSLRPQTKPLKRFYGVEIHAWHRAEAAVLMRSLRVFTDAKCLAAIILVDFLCKAVTKSIDVPPNYSELYASECVCHVSEQVFTMSPVYTPS